MTHNEPPPPSGTPRTSLRGGGEAEENIPRLKHGNYKEPSDGGTGDRMHNPARERDAVPSCHWVVLTVADG